MLFRSKDAVTKVAKLVALRKRLSYKLKNNIVMAITNPATVTDLFTLCNCLDIYHRALQSESQAPICTSHVGASASVMVSISSGTAPGPMDLSANCP